MNADLYYSLGNLKWEKKGTCYSMYSRGKG